MNKTDWLRKQIAKLTKNPQEAEHFVSELKSTDWQSYLEKNIDLPDIVTEIDELKLRVSELEEKTMRRRDKGAPGNLPDGSISAGDFYRQHGVSYSKYRYHIRDGYNGDLLETTKIPHPTKPDTAKERYLTPVQQKKALAYWNKYGVKYIADEEG